MDDRRAKRVLAEYMSMLGMPSLVPEVVVHDNLGSKWLGQTTLKPRRDGTEIFIEIQASALKNEETMRRILAHEAVHVAELSELSEEDLELARKGWFNGPEHGPRFWELARLINEQVGSDFITERSDEEYEVAENQRKFFILVEEVYGERLGWSWAQRLTPGIAAIVKRKTDEGAILVETTDVRYTSGPKIRKRAIGCSVPEAGSDIESALRETWDEAHR